MSEAFPAKSCKFLVAAATSKTYPGLPPTPCMFGDNSPDLLSPQPLKHQSWLEFWIFEHPTFSSHSSFIDLSSIKLSLPSHY
ncbi:hypothetical protein TcasGA2_TC031627 [Tribolium castaneum]|uniref:Uncharacterized protein n=1 Tax=Tribolium castaneum TaxID=7070 RepID=A0A139WA92_TRICA|nr:hypothetical protein TcasGA2_TC031627 [Tribolium castaneum]